MEKPLLTINSRTDNCAYVHLFPTHCGFFKYKTKQGRGQYFDTKERKKNEFIDILLK